MAAVFIIGNKVCTYGGFSFDKVCRDNEIRFHLKPPRWTLFEVRPIS